MSAGPIAAERAGHAVARVSTMEKERVCKKSLLASKAYCGRKVKVAVDSWAKVTCADCHAARRADAAAGVNTHAR